jgi:hypothetical protein
MKRYMLSTILVVATVSLALTPGSALAVERLTYPDEFPGPPYYATPLYVEGEPVTPIIFYHDPESIPEDSNLLGLDFRALDGGLLMDGFVIFGDYGPIRHQLHGSETPVWFVSTTEFEGIAADGVVTMPEVESLSPLKGMTTLHMETIHFIGGSQVPFAEAQTFGFLDDGSSFSIHLTEAWLPPDYEHAIIHYELKIE